MTVSVSMSTSKDGLISLKSRLPISVTGVIGFVAPLEKPGGFSRAQTVILSNARNLDIRPILRRVEVKLCLGVEPSRRTNTILTRVIADQSRAVIRQVVLIVFAIYTIGDAFGQTAENRTVIAAAVDR